MAMNEDHASHASIKTLAPVLRGLLAESETLPVIRVSDNAQVVQAIANIAEEDEHIAVIQLPTSLEPDDVVGIVREALGGRKPRVVFVKGIGLFAAGVTPAEAAELKRACVQAMEKGESVSKAVSAIQRTQRPVGRVSGKVAVVTGAAQGFGLEISQGMASQGANVVLADMNLEGAKAAAKAICDKHGEGRAIGLEINVTQGSSIRDCLAGVVQQYGGLDVFISNAGVLKAGSVKSLSESDFDFVTDVNYKGYFLCVQNIAPILSLQHHARPKYFSDIIQINSKSGLQGSNKNGAYAGGKFGGIGLTQSFAMELIEDGVKVNSICPGNFFDGPLWSDPEKGLFVQYLRTGKVPGAKTIEDVKRFYEDKVPMRRGCTTPDVLKAVYYLIDQLYETGQAVPVTGGQVMLK